MKTFYLITKTGKNLIRKKELYCFDDAIEYFSEMKQLQKEDLLSVFIVTDQL